MCAKDNRDMSQRLGQNPDPHSCTQPEHKQSDDACVYRTERTLIYALHHQKLMKQLHKISKVRHKNNSEKQDF